MARALLHLRAPIYSHGKHHYHHHKCTSTQNIKIVEWFCWHLSLTLW